MNKLLPCGVAILWIPLLLICGGCAFGNREVVLSSMVADSLTPRAAVRAEVIKVTESEDNRGLSPDFIGYVRNGFGVHTADVVASKPVRKWVQDILLENLRAAGYNAVEANGGNDGLVVSSTIVKLDCDMYMSYKATVNLSVALKQNGQVIFSKSYDGFAAAAVLFVTPDEYQAVLNRAMRYCINKMMPELLEQLKQVKPAAVKPAVPEAVAPSTNSTDPF